MVGEVHLAGVAGDERVEPRGLALLGAQDPTEPLGLFLAEPKVPETWIITLASGRSMAKLPTFERTSLRISPARKAR